MPSATGSNWEKYQKKFADDEVEEKKITPLTDEYVATKMELLQYWC
jgi:26S proteasome regulatory subunit T1